MMTEKEDATIKREKWRREKGVTYATFIDLNKQVLKVQNLDTEAKLFAEECRIMLANLSVMNANQRAWFKKK
jgi:hypothetical protein